MARNIGNSRDKLSSLKINTNLEIYDSRTPLSSTSHSKKPSLPGGISPKKTNTSHSNNINQNILSNQAPTPKSNLTQEIENRYKLNAAYAGYRSNSKGGTMSGSNTYNKDSLKLKEALDFDSKFLIPEDTLSPKTTKNGAIKAFSSNTNTHTKYAPMSTRNSSSNQYIGGSNGPTLSYKKESENQSENNSNGEIINVMSLLGAQNNSPISLKNLNVAIPNYDPSKYSVKSMSVIKAYAANTHQGIVRTYNEDRVSIILNIIKPSTYSGEVWPKCSFFGIYDGHGGASCADFLRDSLHQFIIKDQNFPTNIKEAIRRGFEAAEKEFLSQYALGKNGEVIDRSGSCAIITLVVDNMCYIGNVGDSRAVMSFDSGKEFKVLTNDHKPNDVNEKKRIVEAGGKVYQTQTPAKNFNLTLNNVNSNQILVGPHRVFPGRLSVSRTFGDVEAKVIKFGGLPNVITATPEINCFEIKPNMDFIIMGCDGIFDQMNNSDVVNSVWMTTKDRAKAKNIHIQSGTAVDMIIKTSLVRRTLDNVTCVLIAFSNFEKIFQNTVDSVEQGMAGLNINKESSNMNNPNLAEEKNNINSNNKLHAKYESYNGTNYNSNSIPTSNSLNGIYANLSNHISNNYTNSPTNGMHPNSSANFEILKKDPENYYSTNMNLTRKNYLQKKLVSLDLSSSTKKTNQFNTGLNKSDKHDSVNNKNMSSYSNYQNNYNSNSNHNSANQMFDYMPHQQHPSTTKHSHNKIGLMSTLKKTPSARGLGDK